MEPESYAPHILAQHDFFVINSPLLPYRGNVHSQDGEDGIIQRIFELVGNENRYCVEFGAWDGVYFSNCCNLFTNKGWSGMFVEANAEKFKELKANYKGNKKVRLVNTYIDIDSPNTLDAILKKAKAPKDFDFLSIDVDGIDYFIWEGLTDYRPRVVVVEFNPTIPNDVEFVQRRSASVNQGSSLLAMIRLARSKGYELVCCTGWNAFFVTSELYPLTGVTDNGIYSMYKPVSDGRIFHGFDGYVHTTGMPRLIWQDIVLGPDDFQVLTDEQRKFGDSQSQ
jgi:hypothetical protein